MSTAFETPEMPDDRADPYLNDFDPEDEQWDADYDGPSNPEQPGAIRR